MKKINMGCLITLIGLVVIWVIFYYISFRVWCWLWT
nr:MAG TPA_asm: acriflavine resistance protein B [Caudoviricetes sp.]